MIGGIIGDIFGSTYEFKPSILINKNTISLNPKSHPTDDTVLSIAISKALYRFMDKEKYQIRGNKLESNFIQECINYLNIYGKLYPDSGYGKRFKKWLNEENKIPYNSFGNGSAMRVASVGWYANTLNDTLRIAALTCIPTHNHEEGIKGAQAIAGSIYLLRNGATKEEIKTFVESKFGYDLSIPMSELKCFVFNDTCQKTVPQAITVFLNSNSYYETLVNAVSLGGDTDTIACMAGSLAETIYHIPNNLFTSALHIIQKTTDFTRDDFIFYNEVVVPLKGCNRANEVI